MRTTPPLRREGARRLLPVACCLLPLAFCLIAACAGVQTSKFPRLGKPLRPPTDAAQVEVLHRPPMRPFVRLGRIRATPRGGADQEQIETALRQAAATMGANAVIVPRGGDEGGIVEAIPIAYRPH